VGNEWFPYQTRTLLENSPLALAAFASGILALGLHERRMDTRTSASLLAALLFGLMLFQARRFIEYFPPFALLFAAFAWSPLLESLSSLETGTRFSMRRFSPSLLAAGALALVIAAGVWITLPQAQSSLRASKDYRLYAAASQWLQAHTPAGERVFQTDWDDFPRLFYYNTHNTYLIGLDPTYMQLYDPELYDQWVDLTQGKVQQPSEIIRSRFGSSYAISDLAHPEFIFQAENDPGLREVYRDDEAVIFQVLAQP
jgi:asparagine N-glycosylation enzyme membrane subunit Stt3